MSWHVQGCRRSRAEHAGSTRSHGARRSCRLSPGPARRRNLRASPARPWSGRAGRRAAPVKSVSPSLVAPVSQTTARVPTARPRTLTTPPCEIERSSGVRMPVAVIGCPFVPRTRQPVTVVEAALAVERELPFPGVAVAGCRRHGEEAVALEGDVERVAGLLERALLEARHDARDVGAHARWTRPSPRSGSSGAACLRSSPVPRGRPCSRASRRWRGAGDLILPHLLGEHARGGDIETAFHSEFPLLVVDNQDQGRPGQTL